MGRVYMDPAYWIIQYKIRFRSDFHVGAGSTVRGGNFHALRLDDDGMPYLPGTQVRGLIRWGAGRLAQWQQSLRPLLLRNFRNERLELSPSENRLTTWSFTRASVPPETKSPGPPRWLLEQSHVRLNEDGVAERLFSFQKAGFSAEDLAWTGRIYSTNPAKEVDVAFLLAAMRAEDRVGRRRTRGYGKTEWREGKIWRYESSVEREEIRRSFEEWLDLLCLPGDK
jgi:hypothetical protein